MLPKSRRLTTPLFKDTIEKGKIFHSSLFLVRLIRAESPARFSVSVPKKVAKTAVERNKLRRRTYSALRNFEITGVHGVFVAKPTLLKASLPEISSDLHEFFVKIGLMK